jgi:hypothetical protein
MDAQDRKQVFRKHAPGLRSGMGLLGFIAQVLEWIIVEILCLSASVAQVTSPVLSVALRWMYIDLFGADTSPWENTFPNCYPHTSLRVRLLPDF